MQVYYLPILPDKSLPTICRRGSCLRNALKGSYYCNAHQPKKKKKVDTPPWSNKFVIYMIGIEGEPYIKIGKASNFSSRLSSIQVGTPKKVNVIAVFHAGNSSEDLLHRAVQDYHYRGEWFEEDGVLELLKKLLECKKFRCRFNLGEVLAVSDKIAYDSTNNGNVIT